MPTLGTTDLQIANFKKIAKNSGFCISVCSHQVDIPGSVDQEKMQCILSKDGILSVEAPLNQPSPSTSDATFSVNTASPIKSLDMSTPVKNPIITEADGSRKLRLEVRDICASIIFLIINQSYSSIIFG